MDDKLVFDNCIPDCPLCWGVGWTNHHLADCDCKHCDPDHPDAMTGDIRNAMGPCPNKESLLIDVTSPQEVAYAEKWGYKVEG